MSAEENKLLVRRFYEEIDQGNLDAIDELVAEDCVNHHPAPFPGLAPGHHVIEDQVAEGDKVVTRLTAFGTHENDLPGIPRTGAKLEATPVAIHRIAGGKLAEHRSNADELALLQQLGVVPPPEGP